jgi:hypothetical protein
MMMNVVKLFLVSLLGVFICLSSPAAADTTWSTGPLWYEGPAYLGGPELFDKIEIFMVDGTMLSAPVMIDFPQSNWRSVLVNPQYNLITGPETNYVGLFSMQLPAPQNQARTFDYLVYDQGELLYGQTITLGGGHMEYPLMVVPDGILGSDTRPYDRNVASLPGTFLLFTSGMIGLLILNKREQICRPKQFFHS